MHITYPLLRTTAWLKSKLLTVLENLHVLLHNNAEEYDIHTQMTQCKLSADIRSETGHGGTLVYLRLWKTFGKLNLSFWDNSGDYFEMPDALYRLRLAALLSYRSNPSLRRPLASPLSAQSSIRSRRALIVYPPPNRHLSTPSRGKIQTTSAYSVRDFCPIVSATFK